MDRLTKYEKDRKMEKMHSKIASRTLVQFEELVKELEFELKQKEMRQLRDKDKIFLKLNYIRLAFENWFKWSVSKVQSLLNQQNKSKLDENEKIGQLDKLKDVKIIDELIKENFSNISATDELRQLILDHPKLSTDRYCYLSNYNENEDISISYHHSAVVMARVYLQAFKDCCMELENRIHLVETEKVTAAAAVLSESSSSFIQDLVLNVLSAINLDLNRDRNLADNGHLQNYLDGGMTGVDFVNQIIRQSNDSGSSNTNWQNKTKICDAIKHLLDEHQAHGMFSPSAKWEPGLEELLKKTLNEIFLPLANVSLIM